MPRCTLTHVKSVPIRWGLVLSLIPVGGLLSCDSREKHSEGLAAPEKATGVPAPAEQFAGSAACADCHAEIFREWQGSHHAQAQRLLKPDLDREAFDPPRSIHHGSQDSKAQLRDGRYILTTTGRDGQLHDYEPSGAFGVFPLWQYLIAQQGGRIQVTELAYDPAKKEWFDVYGQEDRQPWEWGHWSNRAMNWNSMCAVCHTTAFEKNYNSAADSFSSSFRELGVGCEQCHGRMKSHVDWQTKNRGGSRDPTTKPVDPQQQFSNCASCHSRRSDLTGQFHTGEDFFDHYDLVLPDLTDTFYPDGQIRDEDFEAGPFSLSYMHGQGIRCIDCHSPHTGKVNAQDNSLCLRCHQQAVTNKIVIDPPKHTHHAAGSRGSFCVDCHMPQTAYMQRHWRRDHGMRIPDPLLTKEHGIPNACTRCHAEKGVDWALEHVNEWYGERMARPSRRRAQLLARLKKGDATAAPGLLDVLREEKNPTWRAVCAKFLAPAIDAEGSDAVVSALVNLLNDSSPLVQAAAIETLEPLATTLADKLRPKLNHATRLVRIRAAWALRSELPADSRARQDLIASMRVNEDQPLGAFHWAQFLADTGEPEKAVPWYEKAIKWDPAVGAFRHAYAMTLDALGRPEDALIQAAKAAELEPREAIHAYALGLLFGELGRLAEARDALRAAVSRDSRQGRYWYNLALVESKSGDNAAAIESLSKAEQLEPRVADYPYVRATIYYALKQYDQARATLKRVLEIDPHHQQAQALLREFLKLEEPKAKE